MQLVVLTHTVLTGLLLEAATGRPRSLSADPRREPCFEASSSATTARCFATALDSATARACTPFAACDGAPQLVSEVALKKGVLTAVALLRALFKSMRCIFMHLHDAAPAFSCISTGASAR